ncbi:protein kinase domain-containing protein [Microbulbifer sp.]|uniref:protein kinase domain-containing protein n=1 Tax=Microbulbifer sp. TaxID=1908541 RepID=UPI003F39076F
MNAAQPRPATAAGANVRESTGQLRVSIGQCTSEGRKPLNQDFHGAVVPGQPQLSLKGVALAMADGISSSDVSHVASETAVKSFLEDYYSTSEAWSVRTAATRVIAATNAWLDAQTRRSHYRFERDKGYVCTFSALVLRGDTAHLFHLGDTRVYRLQGETLEQLTNDHRLWVSAEESYLSRALGVDAHMKPDYQNFPLREGQLFILATDGVYEHVRAEFIIEQLHESAGDLDTAARTIVDAAIANGSGDNLSIQIVRVEELPGRETLALLQQADALPLPPPLRPGDELDGYRILRGIHASSRSHAYLAEDTQTNTRVLLKTPSIDRSGDPAYLERFLMEEWIARRVSSVHLLRAAPADRERRYLYTATEYIEGQTLAQWLRDNPKPDLESVRGIVEQIARGLQAMHRMEMLHQDLKPDNIMIDRGGTAKIIDYGATRIDGLGELAGASGGDQLQGTALYAAPEYFIGETPSAHSDLFSLGVLTYHMLCGRFPYGPDVPRARSRAAQRRLAYRSVLDEDSEIPAWVDATLKKAVHPDPLKRYQHLSEFLYDLRHPNKAFLANSRPPLIERNPVAFWRGLALLQFLAILALLYQLQ